MARPTKSAWRFAATLIVAARTKSSGLQPETSPFDYKVLLLKRSPKSSFMPSLHVFPGGGVDAGDFSQRWTDLFTKSGYNIDAISEELRCQHRPPILNHENYPKSSLPTDIALRISALRETFEESGILIARKRKNDVRVRSRKANLPDLASWRKTVNNSAEHFVDLCEYMNIVPDVWSLLEWADWLTPASNRDGGKAKARFDAIFYICTPNSDTESLKVSHDEKETDKAEWLSPDEALLGVVKGDAALAPPQMYEILRLARFPTFEELRTFTKQRSRQGLQLMFPVRFILDDGVMIVFPGDELYPDSPNLAEPMEQVRLTGTMRERRQADSRLHRYEEYSDGAKLLVCNVELPYGHVGPMDIKTLEISLPKPKL